MARQRRNEETRLPEDLDYSSIAGLSNEVRQSSRRSGRRPSGRPRVSRRFTPAAVSILLVHAPEDPAARPDGEAYRREVIAAQLAALAPLLRRSARPKDRERPEDPAAWQRADPEFPGSAQGALPPLVLRDLFEGLTRLDRHAAPVPGAAESWTVSDNGPSVYTFRLRANLKWSNGDPVVTQDFAAGLRRLWSGHRVAVRANRSASFAAPATSSRARETRPTVLASRRPMTPALSITLSGPAPSSTRVAGVPCARHFSRGSLGRLGERSTRAGDQVSDGARAHRLVTRRATASAWRATRTTGTMRPMVSTP